jgi:hypothetical protein
MKTVIVSFEGVNLRSGFIPRELSIYYLADGSFRHYFFLPPRHLELTHGEKQTERFYRTILGGIGLHDKVEGAIPYSNVEYLLLAHAEYSIYTVGHIATRFIAEFLPHAAITNVQDVAAFVYPRTLEPSGCGVAHNPRYCSLSKLKAVRDYCMEHF